VIKQIFGYIKKIMEIWKVLIIVVIAIIALYGIIYAINCEQKNRTYICLKTKGQYYIDSIVKMKDINSGKWVDAVLYVSLKSRKYYVREERQFFSKFITLKEWEENGNGSKS
jgi:hypothetical protein